MKTKLNSLSKLVILFLMFSTTVHSQSITNTLGPNGVFTIKDASSNFFTLSQSTGQVNILKTLRLENTTNSTTGIIFKGTDRFLHNYGFNNTFLGINSGNFANIESHHNTAVGYNSLNSNNIGHDNTALGSKSLYNNIGIRNTAVGSVSLHDNTTGRFNTAVGNFSLYNNTIGNENTSVGYESLVLNEHGTRNTAFGVRSLKINTGGNYNTAVGYESLRENKTGTCNTAVGYGSLLESISGYNTALGYSSGSNLILGMNVTCIGYNSQPSSSTASRQITLGNSDIEKLRCAVQTITSLSDARDKKNITDLTLGLDFLMKVKPRLFNWDKREWYENNISDGSKMKDAPTAGFIAQELDEVQTTENAEWLDLVLKDNPEKLEATSGNLLPVMVKAIQELKAENDLLKQNNEKLSTEVQSLKSMNGKIVKLEQMVNELSSIKQTSASRTNQIGTISNGGDQK